MREGKLIKILFLGTEMKTNKKYAVKTISKDRMFDKIKILLQEIEISLQLEHEFVVQTYEVYEDFNYIHFIMELVDGGDLLNFIICHENGKLPEKMAQQFFYQILEGLSYLHSKNIIHRDIKPENFLVCPKSGGFKIKLIDFGLSFITKEGEKMNEVAGSLQYMPPELFLGRDYDYKIDMWAAGIVLFCMIRGKEPFTGEQDEDYINSIMTQEPVFNPNFFKNIHAKKLCSALLNKDPNLRISIQQAKSSPWIQNYKNMELEATKVGKKFQPKMENIKNILKLLNNQLCVKTKVWNLLLKYLEIHNAELLKEEIMKNYSTQENRKTLGGKFIINYEAFIQEIIYFQKISNELKEKLNGKIIFINVFKEFLKENKNVCRKQVFNFKDFFDSLISAKLILKKKKIKNIFYNLDKNDLGYISYEQVIQAFEEKCPKVNKFH